MPPFYTFIFALITLEIYSASLKVGPHLSLSKESFRRVSIFQQPSNIPFTENLLIVAFFDFNYTSSYLEQIPDKIFPAQPSLSFLIRSTTNPITIFVFKFRNSQTLNNLISQINQLSSNFSNLNSASADSNLTAIKKHLHGVFPYVTQENLNFKVESFIALSKGVSKEGNRLMGEQAGYRVSNTNLVMWLEIFCTLHLVPGNNNSEEREDRDYEIKVKGEFSLRKMKEGSKDKDELELFFGSDDEKIVELFWHSMPEIPGYAAIAFNFFYQGMNMVFGD